MSQLLSHLFMVQGHCVPHWRHCELALENEPEPGDKAAAGGVRLLPFSPGTLPTNKLHGAQEKGLVPKGHPIFGGEQGANHIPADVPTVWGLTGIEPSLVTFNVTSCCWEVCFLALAQVHDDIMKLFSCTHHLTAAGWWAVSQTKQELALRLEQHSHICSRSPTSAEVLLLQVFDTLFCEKVVS